MYVCDICNYTVKRKSTYVKHQMSSKHVKKSLESLKLMEFELKESKNKINELLLSLDVLKNQIKDKDNVIKEKNDIIKEKNDIINKIEIIRDSKKTKKILGFGCIKAEF